MGDGMRIREILSNQKKVQKSAAYRLNSAAPLKKAAAS